MTITITEKYLPLTGSVSNDCKRTAEFLRIMRIKEQAHRDGNSVVIIKDPRCA